MFDDKVILITGGTGSFGYAFTKKILDRYSPRKIIIYSRDEMKQWQMAQSFHGHDSRLRFFLGDVRDRERLYRACAGVDHIVHAAANKIVPTAEYNPFECIKTNVLGAMNVVDAAIDNKVSSVVALSTDKASNPINLYGATKLASDKLFVSSNNYSGLTGCKFSVVRYGNVMGSRGSVIPLFLSLPRNKKYPITDERMTRFMITLDQGVDLVMTAFTEALGGEIFVAKIPSMKVLDILRAVNMDATFEVVGVREGEKLHEQMIGVEEAAATYDYGAYFKILPLINDWHLCPKRIGDGLKVPSDFVYNSRDNTQWMSIPELNAWIKENDISTSKR